MSKILTLIFTLLSLNILAQNNQNQEVKTIVAEGKALYKSEITSWHGVDLFMKNYTDKQNIGGHFSYTENDNSKCVFFSKSDNPKVIGTITFDSTFDIKTAKNDLSEREFTPAENLIFQLRKLALAEIKPIPLFLSNTKMQI